MRRLIQTGFAAVGLTALLAIPTIAGTSSSASLALNESLAGAPKEGDIVDHKFSSPPMNSGGLSSLADLRGRPLLIDFWGVR